MVKKKVLQLNEEMINFHPTFTIYLIQLLAFPLILPQLNWIGCPSWQSPCLFSFSQKIPESKMSILKMKAMYRIMCRYIGILQVSEIITQFQYERTIEYE